MLHAYPAASLDIHDIRRNIYDLGLESVWVGGSKETLNQLQITATASNGAIVVIFLEGNGVNIFDSEVLSTEEVN